MQMTLQQFRSALNADGSVDSYAWPGGYPLYYLCADGESLCPACVAREFARIEQAILDADDSDWRVIAVDVNYEDSSLYCAHCSDRIPSAYAEPE